MAERAEDKIRLNKDRQEADRQIRQHIFEAGGQTALDAYNAAMNHLSGKDREEAKRANASKQKRGFTQVYDEGWQRLQGLMKADSNAARLYAFFAEHMGPDGTLCASRQTLAEALEMGERTISRHFKKLEELNAVVVLKVGSANVYALNPAWLHKLPALRGSSGRHS